MANENENQMTAERLQAELPDVYAEIFEQGRSAGEQAERDRFTELQAACDDNELIVKYFAEGKPATEILSAKIEKLLAEKKELELKLQRNFEVEATDEELKAHYDESEGLKRQFKSPEAYIAYVKNTIRVKSH